MWLWWGLVGAAVLLAAVVGVLVAMGFGAPRKVNKRRRTLRLGLWFLLGVIGITLAAGIWVANYAPVHDAI